jgi:xylose isomerase
MLSTLDPFAGQYFAGKSSPSRLRLLAMTEYFPEIKNKIPFEGPESRNPLAYRYFDPERKVGGKAMKDHLKFAVCYWHTFQGTGGDPFGGASYSRKWWSDPDHTLQASFEFIQKLGVQYYCFHDRDISPDAETFAESQSRFKKMVKKARVLQGDTGIQLLWGTANLFSHPRYTHGAATNPDPLVVAHAATQVKQAIDATVELGGKGYVFWGGREGYSSYLNTKIGHEREQMAKFFHMAIEHGKKAGFKGTYFIEPKPAEPMTHQYDFDAATTLNFLREFGLWDHFALNLEANHATLAGHTFEHELSIASAAGKLGSMDINRGNSLLGWDTDQFPTDLHSATLAMLVVLGQGGLKHGGLNFDAKPRRGSFDAVDLFHAHIGGIDTYARALLVADRMIRDGALSKPLEARYAGFREDHGRRIMEGKSSFDELETWALSAGEPKAVSGREEALENVLNDYLYGTRIE